MSKKHTQTDESPVAAPWTFSTRHFHRKKAPKAAEAPKEPSAAAAPKPPPAPQPSPAAAPPAPPAAAAPAPAAAPAAGQKVRVSVWRWLCFVRVMAHTVAQSLGLASTRFGVKVLARPLGVPMRFLDEFNAVFGQFAF